MSLAHRLFNFISKQSRQSPIGIMMLIALILVCHITKMQHGWVNNDSLLYFECARLISHADWHTAFNLYNWLFYPALIAGVHMLTGLDIHSSAQVLNILFFLLFCWGYLFLIKQAGGQASTMVWGGLLLITTQYIVGDILGMLLRDEGFWAGYVWGLYFLLRYIQEQKYSQALLFQLSMGIATLFRVEALVYSLVLPILTLNICHHESINKRFWRTLSVISLSLIAGLLIVIAVISGLVQPKQLGRLQEVLYLFQQGFTERLGFIQQKAAIMGKEILGTFLDEFAVFSLWSSLILIVLVKTAKVAGWPVLFLLAAGSSGYKRVHPQAIKLFSLQLVLGLLISILIILNTFILSSRYVIASGIVMLVIAAFTTEAFYKRAHPWAKHVLRLLVALMLAANLYDTHRINLDREAVNFIQSINRHHAPVMYDTENARFYAGQPFQNRIPYNEYVTALIDKQKIREYAYLMTSISQHDQDYESFLAEHLKQDFIVIKTFYGWREKNKVVIYMNKNAF